MDCSTWQVLVETWPAPCGERRQDGFGGFYPPFFQRPGWTRRVTCGDLGVLGTKLGESRRIGECIIKSSLQPSTAQELTDERGLLGLVD